MSKYQDVMDQYKELEDKAGIRSIETIHPSRHTFTRLSDLEYYCRRVGEARYVVTFSDQMTYVGECQSLQEERLIDTIRADLEHNEVMGADLWDRFAFHQVYKSQPIQTPWLKRESTKKGFKVFGKVCWVMFMFGILWPLVAALMLITAAFSGMGGGK